MSRKSSRREFLKSLSLSAGTVCAAGAGMFGLSSLESWAAAPPVASPGRPLNIVTLGDSIMWGQGLPEQFKFRNVVTKWLQSQLPGRQVNQMATHAHSGAVTGFGAYPKGITQDPDAYYKRNTGYPYPGEVPFSYPSVSGQIGMTVADLKAHNVNAQDVDLVLLDGGINDVQIGNILNYSDFTTNPAWVRKITNQACTGHMTQLLQQVLSAFSNAAVVITGYYPIVSRSSNWDGVTEFLLGQGVAYLGLAVANKNALADRCHAFADEAFNGLMNLANQTNQRLGTPRVALAWPAFSDDNSLSGPDSYLFRVNEYGADENRGKMRQAPAGDWSTVQGVAYYRAEDCARFSDTPFCYDASMGHPNPAGAHAYADAIISKLQTVFWARLGLPAPPPPPQKMMVQVVDTGVERLGTTASSVWNWVIVSATDVSNNAAVKGATVTVNGTGGASTGPAGRSYYRGPVGQKIYYQNRPTAPAPLTRNTPARTELARPEIIQSRVKLTVGAPGYVTGSATIVIE